ncbi:MAG: hypothetical protein PHQ72_12835 [Hespellia sp.]|nr:hypothetical protein [Hespellia sp.]
MWSDIINEFSQNPRDIKTVPLRGSGIWFYVYVRQGKLFVSKAKNHNLSSKLSNDRELYEREYEKLLALYHQRESGENISKEAAKVTYNQAYWYGVFAALGM